jgi:hypothetical protein
VQHKTNEGEFMYTETQTGLVFEELRPEREQIQKANERELNSLQGIMLGVGLGLVFWALIGAALS